MQAAYLMVLSKNDYTGSWGRKLTTMMLYLREGCSHGALKATAGDDLHNKQQQTECTARCIHGKHSLWGMNAFRASFTLTQKIDKVFYMLGLQPRWISTLHDVYMFFILISVVTGKVTELLLYCHFQTC